MATADSTTEDTASDEGFMGGDARHVLIAQIVAVRGCVIVDDVFWDPLAGEFGGSLLWHGIPTTCAALQAFAGFAADLISRQRTEAVAAVASSGIGWGVAAALSAGLDVTMLRLKPHRYGPPNPGLETLAGRRVLLIDNFAGSGDTLRAAAALLEGAAAGSVLRCVVEAVDPAHAAATLITADKLRRLLAIGYFTGPAREVVRRYLVHGPQWLADPEWVRDVRRRLGFPASTKISDQHRGSTA